MKRRFLPLVAVASAILASGVQLAQSARRPRYGGTLRVEIAAKIDSLDPTLPGTTSEEAVAKDQLEPLVYDVLEPKTKFRVNGPFHVAAFEAGKRAVLAATEDYRLGRPFVDAIEITMGRPARERILDLELNKTDFAEIPAEEARRTTEHGVRVSRSKPDELLALVFSGGDESERGKPVGAKVREAIALSIDRAAIVNFILQKEGEPAGGLLPQWSSGTAFLFSTVADPVHAKELSAQIVPAAKIVLGYDSDDSLERSVAERIAVNARDAGIVVTARAMPRPTGPPAPMDDRIWKRVPGTVDAILARISMPSRKPAETLEDFAGVLGITTSMNSYFVPPNATAEVIYERERVVLSSYRVVPLVWLPRVYGLSARVRDCTPPGPGESWPLADVWLDGPVDGAAQQEGNK